MMITTRKKKSEILASLHTFKSGMNTFGFTVCFNQKQAIRFCTRELMGNINCLLVCRPNVDHTTSLLEDFQNKFTRPVAFCGSSLGKHGDNSVSQIYFCAAIAHPKAAGLCSILVIMWNMSYPWRFWRLLAKLAVRHCSAATRANNIDNSDFYLTANVPS